MKINFMKILKIDYQKIYIQISYMLNYENLLDFNPSSISRTIVSVQDVFYIFKVWSDFLKKY